MKTKTRYIILALVGVLLVAMGAIGYLQYQKPMMLDGNTMQVEVAGTYNFKEKFFLMDAYEKSTSKKSAGPFDPKDMHDFRSSDETRLRVDENGVVTGIATGEAKILFKANGKNYVYGTIYVIDKVPINAFVQIPGRNDYDKAFEKSRNAKMAITNEPCACGESQICVTQSYVDDALGASDVRDCPLDANDIDNLVTMNYAVSKFCLTCQKHTITFHEKDNWIYRERYREPHDHDEENMGRYDLCQIFSTWQDRKVGYLYKVDGTEKTKVSEFTIDEDVDLCKTVFENIGI